MHHVHIDNFSSIYIKKKTWQNNIQSKHDTPTLQMSCYKEHSSLGPMLGFLKYIYIVEIINLKFF